MREEIKRRGERSQQRKIDSWEREGGLKIRVSLDVGRKSQSRSIFVSQGPKVHEDGIRSCGKHPASILLVLRGF